MDKNAKKTKKNIKKFAYVKKKLYLCALFYFMVENIMSVINMFKNVIYVLSWSIGLFVSTFFSCVAKWDFQNLFDDKDVVIGVMMPIIVVMALYLWEEVVNIDTMNNIPASSLKLQLKWTLLSLSVSILCIGLIGVTTNGWRLLFLILSWLSVSCVKFISVYFSNSEIKIVKV